MRRRILIAGLAAGVLAGSATPALASFHLMMVQEIFPGSTANPGQDYIALQMYSSGQNLVGDHTLTVYAANGSVADTATFPVAPGGNVANGANQSTVLIGAASTVVGVAPDLVDPGLTAIDPAGGAACWEVYDCVSWGAFTPPLGGLPSDAGTPADNPGGISDGTDLVRNYAQQGCSTFLDPPDDTDDSNSDLAGALPVPRNNAAAPTEVACASTSITKAPKNKGTDRTPTVKFTSFPLGGTFECRVDDEPFAPCTSPHTTQKLKPGKHTFKVQALGPGGPDPTPAKASFKIVKKH